MPGKKYGSSGKNPKAYESMNAKGASKSTAKKATAKKAPRKKGY